MIFQVSGACLAPPSWHQSQQPGPISGMKLQLFSLGPATLRGCQFQTFHACHSRSHRSADGLPPTTPLLPRILSPEAQCHHRPPLHRSLFLEARADTRQRGGKSCSEAMLRMITASAGLRGALLVWAPKPGTSGICEPSSLSAGVPRK